MGFEDLPTKQRTIYEQDRKIDGWMDGWMDKQIERWTDTL